MSINILVEKLSFYLLQASFLLVPLYFNKNVLRFRTSQEALLFFFVIMLIWITVVKYAFHPKKKLIDYHLISSQNKAIIFFVFILLFSFILSSNKWISFKDFLLFLSYFIFYFVVTDSVTNKKQFYTIIFILFITAFIVSIYTILQYYGLAPILNDMKKITSTIGQKNWVSNYLFMISPIIFIFFLLENKVITKIIYFLLFSIIYLNLIILQSLSIRITIAVVSLLGIGFLFKLKLFKIFYLNKKWLILLVVIFMLITVFYSTKNFINRNPSIIKQRILPAVKGKDDSINGRYLIWHTAYKMFKEKPLFGMGIGIFKMKYLFYQAEVLEDLPRYLPYYRNAQESHNEYLQLLVELGILGLVSFLIIFYLFYKKIFNTLLKQDLPDREKAIISALLLGITGFLIHCLFTFPFHVPALGVTFFGIMGLTVAYTGMVKNKNRHEEKENVINSESNNVIVNQKYKLFSTIIMSILAIFLLISLVFKPYYAEILHFQGLRYTVDRAYGMALTKFDKASRINPYDGKNLLALGGTYLNLGNYEKAEETLIKAKHYYTDVSIFYNLGLIYAQKGLFLKAEEEFKQAVYLNPHFTKGYHSIGLLYFQQKYFDEAINQWNKLLDTEPDFPNRYIVLNNIGIAYQKKKIPEKALEYFLEALKVAPAGSPVIEEIENEISKIY